jgi:hypothetical protein
MKQHQSAVAFALGGLAGNNAHGAGVLQAALDEQVEPGMISCTAGQIRWVHEYLNARRNSRDLRGIMAKTIAEIDRYRNKVLDVVDLSLRGLPGVYRPAWRELWFDTLQNATGALRRLSHAGLDVNPLLEFLQTVPSRWLVPDRDDKFYQEIADRFNHETDIRIVFNSYNPVDGVENVHLNDAARRKLARRKRQSYRHGARNRYRDRTYYQAITPDAVRNGLWLYEYGFDPEDRPREPELTLDGAYFREIILSELTWARRIYVARPINFRWMGALPTNFAGLQDLKTKVAFNGFRRRHWPRARPRAAPVCSPPTRPALRSSPCRRLSAPGPGRNAGCRWHVLPRCPNAASSLSATPRPQPRWKPSSPVCWRPRAATPASLLVPWCPGSATRCGRTTRSRVTAAAALPLVTRMSGSDHGLGRGGK